MTRPNWFALCFLPSSLGLSVLSQVAICHPLSSSNPVMLIFLDNRGTDDLSELSRRCAWLGLPLKSQFPYKALHLQHLPYSFAVEEITLNELG